MGVREFLKGRCQKTFFFKPKQYCLSFRVLFPDPVHRKALLFSFLHNEIMPFQETHYTNASNRC